MISSSFAPDVSSMDFAYKQGQGIGRANSPFTSLNAALGDVLSKYNAHLSAQQAQANAMQLQESKNQNALDVQGLQNSGTAAAAGILPPTEQEQQWLTEDRDNPKMWFDPTTGAGALRNTDIDSKGRVTTKWAPTTAPDPLKLQRAENLRRMQEQEAARLAKLRGGTGMQDIIPQANANRGVAPVARPAVVESGLSQEDMDLAEFKSILSAIKTR